MSNALRYDPLLVRYLAEELCQELEGAPVTALRLAPGARRVVLETGERALVFELHPTRGWARLAAPSGSREGLPLPRRMVVASVAAPADERLLYIAFGSRATRRVQPARLVLELLDNQWNALVLDAGDRILSVLRPRQAGGRVLRAGAVYLPPPPTKRAGGDSPVGRQEWRELLHAVPPAERLRWLVARVAYISPLNAGWILGPAAVTEDAAALDAAHQRYHWLRSLPPAQPQLLSLDGSPQPYPVPLAGMAGRPFPTLLAALEAAAQAAQEKPRSGDVAAGAPSLPEEMLARPRAALQQAERRVKRLRAQLARAPEEAAALRHKADLLLSQVARVRKGMDRAELSDFAGGTVMVELDPALAPAENAQRLYAAARKRQRAAARLPRMLEEAEAELERRGAWLQRALSGEVEAAEIAPALGAAATPPAPAAPRRPTAPAPYRRYRTSGGCEVRVGRNRRANDQLTFHHSAPEDIWLHARDAAGAHVVLRWGRKDQNPPARDLQEAAVLAALHSSARTSGVVAVDWTRRKYVRKPRKAPPGLVAIERVSTLFVEPDASLERRLRARHAETEETE
ncbi:MAG: DUF814 domain-containing protein [Gemmatimonadetes bacterium]|nr:DUF814 domain-containing protein [Gemmatimonadota bacterium]